MKYNKRDILQGAGLRMRKVREQLGYTRREMAQHLGITVNGYRKNESGECFPNTKSLFQLSTEYGISMDWLFFNNGPMYLKEMKRLQDLDKTEPELSHQLADCKAKLASLEQETAEIRQATPEIKEMVIQMGQNPILFHELLLHFHQFVKENPPVQKEKKKKKQPGKEK
jgi:transcriptional regulator with XRE-family HTH domain